jgi:hypothetical protein
MCVGGKHQQCMDHSSGFSKACVPEHKQVLHYAMSVPCVLSLALLQTSLGWVLVLA